MPQAYHKEALLSHARFISSTASARAITFLLDPLSKIVKYLPGVITAARVSVMHAHCVLALDEYPRLQYHDRLP